MSAVFQQKFLLNYLKDSSESEVLNLRIYDLLFFGEKVARKWFYNFKDKESRVVL